MSNIRSVLIIGGSGFIGTHLALRLRQTCKVYATYHAHRIAIPGVTCVPLNVDNRNWIKTVVNMCKPDVIVYAPALPRNGKTPPEYADLERVHSKGAATLLSCAEVFQPRFIFLSSCYVFDGHRGNYREGEPALPATPDGKARMAGENFIRGRSLHAIILRSSPVFGRGNGLNLSFLDRLRMSLDRGKAIEVPSDEVHSFAPVEGLTELISELVSHPNIRNRTLHYGGLTKMSWADLAKSFAKKFGYDPKLILPAKTNDPTRKGGRDDGEFLDYSLNSSQAIELLKLKPMLFRESLEMVEKSMASRL